MTTHLRVDRRGHVDFVGVVGISVAVGRASNLAMIPTLGGSNPVGGGVRFGLGFCSGVGSNDNDVEDEDEADDTRFGGGEAWVRVW